MNKVSQMTQEQFEAWMGVIEAEPCLSGVCDWTPTYPNTQGPKIPHYVEKLKTPGAITWWRDESGWVCNAEQE